MQVFLGKRWASDDVPQGRGGPPARDWAHDVTQAPVVSGGKILDLLLANLGD